MAALSRLAFEPRDTPSAMAAPSGREAAPQFTTFSESGGLSKNAVRALAEDRDGSLWIGTGKTEILELLARGHLYKEIAHTLGISPQTVNGHIKSICEKLHGHSLGQAVAA